MEKFTFILLAFFIFSCQPEIEKATPLPTSFQNSLIILGNIQDAGSPHIGCAKKCCAALFKNNNRNRKVVCLGLVDHDNEKKYLFEATPDITTQLKDLKNYATFSEKEMPDGIFLTHAHIGHYTGLMYLGKEAKGAKNVPVYAMPRMKTFLEENGPWSQLVSHNNIEIRSLKNNGTTDLTPNLKVTPFTVPHRDEYSETVGYTIQGPNKKVLFITDINKWEKWDIKIEDVIANVDYAFLDGTFYDGAEINHRDISQIPHPFIIESLERFKDLTLKEKNKIHFIHFNHTNPVLDKTSEAYKKVIQSGLKVAEIGAVFEL